MYRFENHIQITITMGGTVSSGKSNDELIDHLVEADFIKTPLVQRVFRAVDRGNYYAPSQRGNAYKDIAWRMGNLHLSAPCVYSVVMEALKLRPGLSFLNLGSGSGYLSTMAGLVLGPFGINHGIELYSEIVDFAYDRLDEFLKNAKAVDEYEFCEPMFTVGNCLKLDNALPRYDRVYCGASCPEEYEYYVRSLVKVGGILVMPLNDKLLKLTRLTETRWHTLKVLSVSFAPLVKPPTLYEPGIKLSDICPPTLQQICRASIRTLLRSHVDAEHPDLKQRQLRKERHPRRQVRRIVIPFYDESDSNSQSESEFDVDSDGPEYTISSHLPSRMSVYLEDFLRRHAELQLLREMEEDSEQEVLPKKEEQSSAEESKEGAEEDSKQKTDAVAGSSKDASQEDSKDKISASGDSKEKSGASGDSKKKPGVTGDSNEKPGSSSDPKDEPQPGSSKDTPQDSKEKSGGSGDSKAEPRTAENSKDKNAKKSKDDGTDSDDHSDQPVFDPSLPIAFPAPPCLSEDDDMLSFITVSNLRQPRTTPRQKPAKTKSSAKRAKTSPMKTRSQASSSKWRDDDVDDTTDSGSTSSSSSSGEETFSIWTRKKMLRRMNVPFHRRDSGVSSTSSPKTSKETEVSSTSSSSKTPSKKSPATSTTSSKTPKKDKATSKKKKESAGKKSKRTRSSSNKQSKAGPSGEDSASKKRSASSSSPEPRRKKMHRTAATVVWKKYVEEKKEADKPKEEEEGENYTSLMIQKIGALPLPSMLLRYLNYKRENL